MYFPLELSLRLSNDTCRIPIMAAFFSCIWIYDPSEDFRPSCWYYVYALFFWRLVNRETAGNTVAGRSTHQGQEDDRPTRDSFGLKRSASKRLMSWVKLISWKGAEQEECAVCLEKFMSGETLMSLPCNHRFHSGCLVPWLVNNSQCPCCRAAVPS